MRLLIFIISLISVLAFAGGCNINRAAVLGCPSPEDRHATIIESARELVLASDISLQPTEIPFINRTDPDIKIYAIGGVCGEDGQYFIQWRLPNGSIVVSGIGDLDQLSNATVERTQT